MTRKFKAKETQTGFMGWIRNNPSLDSVASALVIQDSDFWVHKYKTINDRSYQFLMLVELKEFGASLSDSQRDTLHIINQLLRNRPNIRANWNADDFGPRITSCHSLAQDKKVSVHSYGAHVLQIDGDGTFTHWQDIFWDNKPIDVVTLEGLLRFEIDPDTLGKLDHRPDSRHKTTVTKVEEKMPLGFTTEKVVVRRS